MLNFSLLTSNMFMLRILLYLDYTIGAITTIAFPEKKYV